MPDKSAREHSLVPLSGRLRAHPGDTSSPDFPGEMHKGAGAFLRPLLHNGAGPQRLELTMFMALPQEGSESSSPRLREGRESPDTEPRGAAYSLPPLGK